MSWKSGSLNLLEHSGPHRACYGTALPFFYLFFYWAVLHYKCTYFVWPPCITVTSCAQKICATKIFEVNKMYLWSFCFICFMLFHSYVPIAVEWTIKWLANLNGPPTSVAKLAYWEVEAKFWILRSLNLHFEWFCTCFCGSCKNCHQNMNLSWNMFCASYPSPQLHVQIKHNVASVKRQ